MIKIFLGEDYAAASAKAAEVIRDVVKAKADAVLGLATGSSPVGMYRDLAEMNRRGEISFAKCKSVNLDEYVGLAPEHDQSYAYFMAKNFFDNIDIDKKNTNLPSGLAADLAAECRRYDGVIASMGGVDIQVLGIGNNGHIGFNEPADSFSKGTGIVDLTASTIDANARFFATRDEVPTRAISMGVGQIVAAKRILLLAMGAGKAEILERALFGDVTPRVPASILQFCTDVTVCADRAALAEVLRKHPEVTLF